MENALEKTNAVMKKGVNRKCVKDEKTCHREVEKREGKIERILKEAKNKIENRVEIK